MTARNTPQQNRRLTDTSESLLLSALLATLIYYFNGVGKSDLFSSSLQDSGHTAVFFVATLLLGKTLSSPFLSKRIGQGLVIPITFFGGMITAIMIELIQPAFGRSGSFLDIWYDLLGCTAGILLFTARYRIQSRPRKALAVGGTCFLLSISSILPAYFYHVTALRDETFPTIFNAEANWQNELFRINRGAYINIVSAPTSWTNNHSKVLRLDLSHDTYPGIEFHQLPKDWRQYHTLNLDVFSKLKETTNLVIRINDMKHNQEYNDRFNQTLPIKTGLNQIVIPMADIRNAPQTRQLDLNEIGSLILFSTEAKPALSFYLDNLRLE